MTQTMTRSDEFTVEVDGLGSLTVSTAPPRSTAWQTNGACATPAAADLMTDPEQESAAIAICHQCPVRAQCAAWALGNLSAGVTGGLTEKQRTALRAEHGIPDPDLDPFDYLPPAAAREISSRPQVDRYVISLIEDGHDDETVSTRAGVTESLVARRRAKLAA